MKRVQFCYQGRCVTCWLSRRLWGTERPDGRLLLHMQRSLTYYILHKVYLWNKDATENETFFMAWTAFLFWKTFLHEKSNLIRRLLKDMVWEGELCNLELKQHLLKTPHVPDLEDSNRPEACKLMSLCWRSLKGPTHIASALFLFRSLSASHLQRAMFFSWLKILGFLLTCYCSCLSKGMSEKVGMVLLAARQFSQISTRDVPPRYLVTLEPDGDKTTVQS